MDNIISICNKIVLFDTRESYENLLPLSYTRPVAEFRIGIVSLREKWEHFLSGNYSYYPMEFLREKFPLNCDEDEEALFIAGNKLPDKAIALEASQLKHGEALRDNGGVWAFRGSRREFERLDPAAGRESANDSRRINYVYDVFGYNADEIVSDFLWLTRGRTGVAPDKSTVIIGEEKLRNGVPALFIEKGAVVEGATINLKDGPVYIGKNARVMEGACLRGPLAICTEAKIKMGAKIYGGTTFGPFCKVGGEVDNTVMFGFSNKAHDGYLGNAVIGEWCNIGAGTNSSNLKNDYSKIRIWNYAQQRFMRTDLQFCGLIMADHSKAGINCMFNTATVVGVGVNFHGAGFPRTFIPSFSAGSPEAGFSDVPIDKFMQTASRVMGRRGLELTDIDRHIFEKIHESASKYK
ncbi:MAG: glucose-1-phosphate thymidylyltransferase [Candidatus Amulumruptor caecigallinarius]|nr:glucose-1-phosphate thymidylyltransferase [Candidatus Amulumruptor caecigallinarius]